MRESINSVPLFNIVIVFVFLFTGYVSLSINLSKAYNVKNEIVSIIKNQGGVCTANVASSDDNNCYNFAEQIRDYFSDAAYHSSGNCDGDQIGYDRNGEYLGAGANNAAFCIKAISVASNSELPNAVYYQVEIFYHLDIPVVSRLTRFSLMGETSRVYEPNECKFDRGNYGLWCN